MFTTEDKISYFRFERIPSLQAKLKSLADESDPRYQETNDKLLKAIKRVEELEKEQEFLEVIGNPSSTVLQIELPVLLAVCAEKTLDIFLPNTPSYATKFRSGKAQFEKIKLTCWGRTLFCWILSPTVERMEIDHIKFFKISFECVEYEASLYTQKEIEEIKRDPSFTWYETPY